MRIEGILDDSTPNIVSDPQDLAKQVEGSLIAADIQFFLDVVFDPHLRPLQGNAVLSLMPFFSSFMIDSAEYLRRNGIASNEFLQPHERLLRTSRLRLKPLEVKDKSFEEVLNEITELVEMNSYWFLGSRPVFIRFLQKLFWGDMGVGFVGTEVFSTTHVSSLNIGLTKEIIEQHSIDLHNLGTYLRETSVDLGRYVGALAEVLGVPLDVTDRSAEASPPTLGYRDYQSARFYERLSASISSILAVNVMVMALISQTNVARLLVPVLAGQNELASLKLRLLSLYHAKIALGRLLGENRRVPILQPDAQNYIRAALDSPHVQNIARNRLLRNAFIHYGVEAREAVNLTKALPLNGFIEAHTEGQSLAEVELDVTLGLDHLSKNLRLLLPEGLAPKRNFA